ncbi:DMT family transporter [Frateuria sp. GZRe12]|uniref:DMT family transporter n=1 Tax=Frateuria sp. GZRe12 TaxID=3351533 RepID=UPI003EDB9803
MRRAYLSGFLLLMAFDTLSQISFKLAGTHALPVAASLAWVLRLLDGPWIYGAVVGYLGAFFTWMSLLRHAPIGPAFAASHLEVVSVMLLSVWLFHEPLTMPRVVGACAIVAGIVCLGLAEARIATGEVPGDRPLPHTG